MLSNVSGRDRPPLDHSCVPFRKQLHFLLNENRFFVGVCEELRLAVVQMTGAGAGGDGRVWAGTYDPRQSAVVKEVSNQLVHRMMARRGA